MIVHCHEAIGWKIHDVHHSNLASQAIKWGQVYLRKQYRAFHTRMIRRFGGWTRKGQAEGAWLSPAGELYTEEHWVYEVAHSHSDLQFWLAEKERLKEEFGQEDRVHSRFCATVAEFARIREARSGNPNFGEFGYVRIPRVCALGRNYGNAPRRISGLFSMRVVCYNRKSWEVRMPRSFPSALVTDKGQRVQLRIQGRFHELTHEELRELLGLPKGPPGLGITIQGDRLEFEFAADSQIVKLSAGQLHRRLARRFASKK